MLASLGESARVESDKTSGYLPEIEHRNLSVLFRLTVPLIERVDSTGGHRRVTRRWISSIRGVNRAELKVQHGRCRWKVAGACGGISFTRLHDASARVYVYTFRIRLRFESKERRNRAIPDITVLSPFFFYMESWDTRIFFSLFLVFSSLFSFLLASLFASILLLLVLFFSSLFFFLFSLYFLEKIEKICGWKVDPRPRFYNITRIGGVEF